MLDVGNEPHQQNNPNMLKYSSEYIVRNMFNKMNYSYLNISKCSGNVFENSFATKETFLKDMISIENTHIINLGFCEYYHYNCNKTCTPEYIKNINDNLDFIKRSWSTCSDQHIDCESGQVLTNAILTKSLWKIIVVNLATFVPIKIIDTIF